MIKRVRHCAASLRSHSGRSRLKTTKSGPYDVSVVIRPGFTSATRPTSRKPYDANLGKSTMTKKFVTLICHEAQSLQRRCGLRLRPTQFPVYAYVLSFTLLLLSKRQHLVRVVDYSLPDRDFHPARGTKLRLAHTMTKKFVTTDPSIYVQYPKKGHGATNSPTIDLICEISQSQAEH